MDMNEPAPGAFVSTFNRTKSRYQSCLDAISIFPFSRWVTSLLLLIIFFYRMIMKQGFYLVAYASGIYILHQFIHFLSPKIDPAYDEYDDIPTLPTKSSEEFRPFMRRLPEFKFWLSVFKVLLLSVVCTFFPCFDIPVFWPILVLYFCLLFLLSMKRQILHMIRYRYLPFTYGKVRYATNANVA